MRHPLLSLVPLTAPFFECFLHFGELVSTSSHVLPPSASSSQCSVPFLSSASAETWSWTVKARCYRTSRLWPWTSPWCERPHMSPARWHQHDTQTAAVCYWNMIWQRTTVLFLFKSWKYCFWWWHPSSDLFLPTRSLQRNQLQKLNANSFLKYQNLQKLWVCHVNMIRIFFPYMSLWFSSFELFWPVFVFRLSLKTTFMFICLNQIAWYSGIVWYY